MGPAEIEKRLLLVLDRVRSAPQWEQIESSLASTDEFLILIKDLAMMIGQPQQVDRLSVVKLWERMLLLKGVAQKHIPGELFESSMEELIRLAQDLEPPQA